MGAGPSTAHAAEFVEQRAGDDAAGREVFFQRQRPFVI